ncbi:MAG: hypothetical protein M3552_03720 [Planctomycetota bacterium]|nr:hypothetical protein [Planctomycetota bacterium]
MQFRLILIAGSLSATLMTGCESSQPVAEEPQPATESDIQLSETEIQALADEQKVCAVAGEPLGSMGTPVPVQVTDSTGTDHTVLLCCESCRESLLSDPDKYLAQLASVESDAATP